MQFYLDTSKESDRYSLPDGEVFWAEEGELWGPGACSEEDTCNPPGFYWWVCFPGCLPDSDACGPFPTQQEAIKDARDMHGS